MNKLIITIGLLCLLLTGCISEVEPKPNNLYVEANNNLLDCNISNSDYYEVCIKAYPRAPCLNKLVQRDVYCDSEDKDGN